MSHTKRKRQDLHVFLVTNRPETHGDHLYTFDAASTKHGQALVTALKRLADSDKSNDDMGAARLVEDMAWLCQGPMPGTVERDKLLAQMASTTELPIRTVDDMGRWDRVPIHHAHRLGQVTLHGFYGRQ